MAVAYPSPVTSVNLTVPPTLLTVTGGPITASGTLAVDLATLPTGNLVFAVPISGGSGQPLFRALLANDLPSVMNGTSFTGAVGIGAGLQLATNTVSSNYSLS